MNEEQPQPNPMDAMFEQSHLAMGAAQQAKESAMTNYYLQEQDKNLAEAQLDCSGTLEEIYHLLRQDVLKPSEKGIMGWSPLVNEEQRILTEEGVERIMQVMKSYVNKETLLSNFDEKQINRRMLEFCNALNGNIFMKYEVYFRKPSFEECKKIFQDRVQEQYKLRKFANEIVGKESKIKEVQKEITIEVENKIEYEIKKIRQERIRQNLREYELVFVQLKAMVEAIHNRAYRGEERGSLRRHTNISEIIGGRMPQDKKQGGLFGIPKQ